MENDENSTKEVETAVIDKVQEVVNRAKAELETVQCQSHGQALKKLDFDRANGSFKIETCCEAGEKLVNDAIAALG